jgi:hypothetical protein
VPFTTEQHREYQKQRRFERLALARTRLGGVCVVCGSMEGLDFDHIDPSSKTRKISEATNWSLQRFLSEVDKCQLLCREHHTEKSQRNGELSVRGEQNARTKLTEPKVRDILGSPLSSAELAEQYDVTVKVIQSIRARRTWKHVSIE